MANNKHFTSQSAAEYLGISLSTLYRMEKKGLINPFRTPGGQRRFSQEVLDGYLTGSSEIKAPQNPSQYKQAAQPVTGQADSAPETESETPSPDNAVEEEEASTTYLDDSWEPVKLSQHVVDLRQDDQ